MVAVLARREPKHAIIPATSLRSALTKRAQPTNDTAAAVPLADDVSVALATDNATPPPRAKKQVRLAGIVGPSIDKDGELIETVHPVNTVVFDNYSLPSWQKREYGANSRKRDREAGDDEAAIEGQHEQFYCRKRPRLELAAGTETRPEGKTTNIDTIGFPIAKEAFKDEAHIDEYVSVEIPKFTRAWEKTAELNSELSTKLKRAVITDLSVL